MYILEERFDYNYVEFKVKLIQVDWRLNDCPTYVSNVKE